MNSEILSTSVLARQASANPLAAITADLRMHLQDQRNSGDVVLNPGSPAAARPQPAHEAGQRDARPAPGRAGDLAA